MSETTFSVLGDTEDHDEVFQYAHKVASYLCNKMWVRAVERDEVFNDGYMAAIEAKRSYEDTHSCSLKTWTYTICRNRIIDGLRSRNWFNRRHGVGDTPFFDGFEPDSVLDLGITDPGFEKVEDAMRFQQILNAVELLAPNRKKVILGTLAGELQRDMAVRDGVTEAAIALRKRHAIEDLRSILLGGPNANYLRADRERRDKDKMANMD